MSKDYYKKIKPIFLIVVVLSVIFFIVKNKTNVDSINNENINQGDSHSILIKGELKEINRGCAYDLACTITIDDKVIETSPGHVREDYREELGINIGMGDISEINNQNLEETGYFIFSPKDKTMVEAYVHVHEDGKLSIYGSNDYYIRVIK